MRELALMLCLAVTACTQRRPGAQNAPRLLEAVDDRESEAEVWLRAQRPVCGEIVGRVRAISTGTGARFPGAMVSIDSTKVFLTVDTVGTFRIRRAAEHPQPATLRVRRIGMPSAVMELPRDISKAYLADIVLAGGSMHGDSFTTVRVREAWTCEPAT